MFYFAYHDFLIKNYNSYRMHMSVVISLKIKNRVPVAPTSVPSLNNDSSEVFSLRNRFLINNSGAKREGRRILITRLSFK